MNQFSNKFSSSLFEGVGPFGTSTDAVYGFLFETLEFESFIEN